jgi:hypothetical protein
MKANKVNIKAVQIELPGNGVADLKSLLYEYPEKENRMVCGGSSHVLNDFLDFTDYLIPVCRSARNSYTEDYYSALSSL